MKNSDREKYIKLIDVALQQSYSDGMLAAFAECKRLLEIEIAREYVRSFVLARREI